MPIVSYTFSLPITLLFMSVWLSHCLQSCGHISWLKFGSRAFCSSGAVSWNTLPAHLRLPSLPLYTPSENISRHFFLFSWDCRYTGAFVKILVNCCVREIAGVISRIRWLFFRKQFIGYKLTNFFDLSGRYSGRCRSYAALLRISPHDAIAKRDNNTTEILFVCLTRSFMI